ncbi:MAG: hypothetical protein LBU04_05600 [Christensenellaceae bacterium]|jgi:hypothetical protein|nr:hypothetical protein [Christensenellaceae bacterium]
MSLIKKTVALTGNKINGYITFVRIGYTSGAKIIINEKDCLFYMGIKISAQPQIFTLISAEKTEIQLSSFFSSLDQIGVIMLDSALNICATGGDKAIVNISMLKQHAKYCMSAQTDDDEKLTHQILTTSKIDSDKYQKSSHQKQNNDEKYPDSSTFSSNQLPSTISIETKIKNESCNNNICPVSSSFLNDEIVPPLNATSDQSESINSTMDSGVSQIRTQASADNNIFTIPSGDRFYQRVKSRIEELMTINPKEDNLESLIPDSRWAKIEYADDEYYVIGLLTNEGKTTHIAYGVPGIASNQPPKEAEDLCDFLPVPGILGFDGYWLLLQDIDNGTIIRN